MTLRTWTSSRLLTLFVLLAAVAGCSIDIPQSFYKDASPGTNSDTPKLDTVGDSATTPDTAVVTDVTVADVADAAASDAGDAAITPDALADALADAIGDADVAVIPDIAQPDIQQPDGGCTLDEQCPIPGELELCQEMKCVQGECLVVPMEDGTPCDDPEAVPGACTTDEHCETGKCRILPLQAGTPCGDTDLCFEDRCSELGSCLSVPILQCDDGNDCTDDYCDPASGCQVKDKVGVACDDGDACTDDDQCTEGGGCAGTVKVCPGDPENPCVEPACNTETGECSIVPVQGVVKCDDNNLCTLNDSCKEGVCTGVPKCAEKVACLKPTCTETGECQYFPAPGQSCSDGNPCTLPDTCECTDPQTCSLACLDPLDLKGCAQKTTKCVGQPIPFERPCAVIGDCGYPGFECTGGMCQQTCADPGECPPPIPSGNAISVCSPVEEPICGIVIKALGKTCVDGSLQ